MSAHHGHHGQFHASPPNASANVNASQGASPKSRRDKFPVKLMEILSNDQYIDCIAWLPHGRSFVIHSPERFTEHVLPKITKPCKFSSFTRKLYRWGFRQISKGPDAGEQIHTSNMNSQTNRYFYSALPSFLFSLTFLLCFVCLAMPFLVSAESFFHKHFRRDKTTLCNMSEFCCIFYPQC